MRRNYLSVYAFVWVIPVMLCWSLTVYASPPEDIQMKYNLRAQTLLVTITHDSMFKGSHFIKFVEIKKNGTTVSINTYHDQPTGKTFTYTYRIPAIEEDTFVADCTCSKGDKKTSSMLTVK